MVKRFVWAVAFVIVMFGTAFADIADPYIFRRQPVYEPEIAAFRVSHSSGRKNSIELEIIPASNGDYKYSFILSGSDGTEKVIKSSDGHYSKKEDEAIKAEFLFRLPERGKTLNYVLKAEFVQRPRTRRRFTASLTRRITVSNIEGTVYVFIDPSED